MISNALEALYATLPEIACKGLCARSCGPILSTRAEAERAGASFRTADVRADLGPVVLWATDRKLRCHKLRNGRCTVYAQRPAICRLWGIAEGMPCLWGCVPERMLSRDEAIAFLDAVARLTSSAATQPV